MNSNRDSHKATRTQSRTNNGEDDGLKLTKISLGLQGAAAAAILLLKFSRLRE